MPEYKESVELGFVHCLFTGETKDKVSDYIQSCLTEDVNVKVKTLCPLDFLDKRIPSDVDENGTLLHWPREHTRRLLMEMQDDLAVDLILVSKEVYEDNCKQYLIDKKLIKPIGHQLDVIDNLKDRLKELLGNQFDESTFFDKRMELLIPLIISARSKMLAYK